MADSTPVWLFYPNLIGYGRVVLGILAMWWFPGDPVKAIIAYFLSAFLDAFDGWAARTFNQSSRFGAMLDQLTDRCFLLALTMTLCVQYPAAQFWLQLAAVIDIGSHWLHLHATDLAGRASHKGSSNPLLHLYYTSRPFLGFMCAGNEAFYLSLYMRAFFPGPVLVWFHLATVPVVLAFPIAVVKTGISLVHLYTASCDVLEYDEKKRKSVE